MQLIQKLKHNQVPIQKLINKNIFPDIFVFHQKCSGIVSYLPTNSLSFENNPSNSFFEKRNQTDL